MEKKTMQNLAEKTPPINYTDRQSVRTSFGLTELGIDALKWLTKHHGITAKDVFDKFCQDSFLEEINDMIFSKTRDDQTPASTVKPVRKTVVISKGALKTLKEFSKKHKISRDGLVEISLILLRLVAVQALKEEKANNPRALEIISEFISQADSVEEKLNEIFKFDSPILKRFSYMMIILEDLERAIESNLKDGTPIDPDDYSQVG